MSKATLPKLAMAQGRDVHAHAHDGDETLSPQSADPSEHQTHTRQEATAQSPTSPPLPPGDLNASGQTIDGYQTALEEPPSRVSTSP